MNKEAEDISIKEAQSKVDQWIQTVGQRYFNELTNTTLLMEEVGELSRIMARVYGEQSFKEVLSEKEINEKLSEEMADVFFVLLCLANQCKIDLSSALLNSLKKKTERDKARHKNNPKLK